MSGAVFSRSAILDSGPVLVAPWRSATLVTSGCRAFRPKAKHWIEGEGKFELGDVSFSEMPPNADGTTDLAVTVKNTSRQPARFTIEVLGDD